MISHTTLAHVRRAGLSLRTWRDQTLASALDPGYSPRSHRRSLWITWGVMVTAGTAGAILAGAWWAPPVAVTATVGEWWIAHRTAHPRLADDPPWWGPATLACASWWGLAATVCAIACGAAMDIWLRTWRHTSMRAAIAAATAACALAAGTLAVCVLTAAWAAYLAWCVHRLRGAHPRKATTPPPPDLPLRAALRWERATTRRGNGRAEPMRTTLAKVVGTDSPTARQVAIKQEGLAAELASGAALAHLPRGYRVMHDLALPGARTANIDHLIIGPTGIVVVDTKVYGGPTNSVGVGYLHGRFAAQDSRGGLRDLTESITQILWAARAVSQALGGLSTRAVMLIHHADVQPGLVAADQDDQTVTITLIDPDHLDDAVTASPTTLSDPWDKEQIGEVCGHVHQILTAADGREVIDLPTTGPGRPLSGEIQPPPVVLCPTRFSIPVDHCSPTPPLEQ